VQGPSPGQKTAVAVVTSGEQGQATRYEMRVSGKWMECAQAKELTHGWLQFQSADGRTGLAPVGTWRKLPPKQ
jgi:hypothetical protein